MRIGISAFSSAENSGSRWWNWKTKPTRRLRKPTSASSDSVAEVPPVDDDSAAVGTVEAAEQVQQACSCRRRWPPSPPPSRRVRRSTRGRAGHGCLGADAVTFVEGGGGDEGHRTSLSPSSVVTTTKARWHDGTMDATERSGAELGVKSGPSPSPAIVPSCLRVYRDCDHADAHSNRSACTGSSFAAWRDG